MSFSSSLSPISFKIQEFERFTLVSISLNRKGDDGRGIALPEDIKGLHNIFPEINSRKGVILDGAAPIWLHSALAHLCHSCAWVAHNDPRQGGVVVQSHVQGVSLGDIIEL